MGNPFQWYEISAATDKQVCNGTITITN